MNTVDVVVGDRAAADFAAAHIDGLDIGGGVPGSRPVQDAVIVGGAEYSQIKYWAAYRSRCRYRPVARYYQ